MYIHVLGWASYVSCNGMKLSLVPVSEKSNFREFAKISEYEINSKAIILVLENSHGNFCHAILKHHHLTML